MAAVTNASGNLYRQYVYDPYGNIISVKDKNGTSISIDNDPGFNNAYTHRGYRFDSESGLYFLNSRYYAAGIGRFLTKDSVKGVTTDPQSLNSYAYAEGDPVNRVDPSGHAADETEDPNNPYVSPGAGPADTGKLEFGNSGASSTTSTKQHSSTDTNKTNQTLDNLLLTVNRGASVVSIGASMVGIIGIAVGSGSLVLASGVIIPVAAVAGFLTTLGMMAIGDHVHGSWGSVALSLTRFLSIPMLGGAALLEGTELFNAARTIGFAFNIPLSLETANWN